MTRTERRFVLLWLALVVITAVLFTVPWLLAMLIIFGIGLLLAPPLMLAPSAAAYLSVILAIYWPARLLLGRAPASRTGIALVGSMFVILGGFWIATNLNAAIMGRADSLIRGDGGSKPLLKPQPSIALVSDTVDDALRCSGDCQRLLYRGLTRRVLIMSPEGLEAAQTRKPFRVGVHELVRRGEGCGKVMLGSDFLTTQEWGSAPRSPRVWDYQDILSDRGECVRSATGNDPRAATYLVDIWNFHQLGRDANVKFMSVPRPTWKRQEVLERANDGWSRLYRRTQVAGLLLGTPLTIEPPFSFTQYSPGKLATAGSYTRGKEVTLNGMMGTLIMNDLRLPDLVERIRRLDGSPRPNEPSTPAP